MAANDDKFCILPFVHTAIEANGDIKACCMAEPFRGKEGRSLNLNHESLHEVFASDDFQNFLRAFRENKEHPHCNACWRSEKEGALSNRLRFNDFYHEWTKEIRAKPQLERDLKCLEVKVGTHCNLKCRICGPHNSSKAAREWFKLGIKDAMDSTLQARWIEKAEVWRDLAEYNFDKIHILGGEPFLDRTHVPMLEGLVKSGRAARTLLTYNTNGTVYPTELMPLFEKFGRIAISLSLDDIGSRFEYQRFPARWEAVKANLKRLWSLSSPRLEVYVDICWSVFNIAYIDEIIDFYEGFLAGVGPGLGNCLAHGTHLYSGRQFCPTRLHPNEKSYFIERLNSSKAARTKKYADLVRVLKQHIRAGQHDTECEIERKHHLQWLDRARGQSFAGTFPEIAFLAGTPPS